MAKSYRAGMPDDHRRSLFLLLRKSGDAIEATTPPFPAAAGADRLRDAAQAKGLLLRAGNSGNDLAVTPAELEEEAPPFDVEAGAARLQEAARARGLLPGGASEPAVKASSRARKRDRSVPGQRGGSPIRSQRRAPSSRTLIIVQNLSVPFDRRVWLECQAHFSAGRQVAVVCPKDKGDPAYQVLDGVELYKYRRYAPGGGKLSHVAEYAYSLAATAWLTLKARRRWGSIGVLQVCNPPDIFWPIALALRGIDRTVFVFDYDSLCPELFKSRFPNGPKLPYRALLAMERWTHRTADQVIATNDSYREIAIARGGKSPADVTVVRTGPDPQRLKRGPEYPELRRGRRYLAAYIGIMGPQGGVDIVVRAADIVINKLGRDDIAFTIMGSGDCLDDLIALRDKLGLAGHVEFTGRVPDEVVTRVLSTADIGLSPAPKNPLNDLSTMNKSMEYMSFELPVVAFDLRETRVSCGNAAVYATPNDEYQYAQAIVALMDDELKRAELGKLGRDRVEQELAWSHQERAYLDVYARLLGYATSASARIRG